MTPENPADAVREALPRFALGLEPGDTWTPDVAVAVPSPTGEWVRYADVQARLAAAALAGAAPDTVMVPASALRWLFGEEGEFVCPPDRYFRGKEPPYWWRSVLREKIEATPHAPAKAREVTEADVMLAIGAHDAYWEAQLSDCSRCGGKGHHHGFGEDGNDPDWCGVCGGGGIISTGSDEGAMRAALATFAEGDVMNLYPSIAAGEEVFPEMKGYKMACCDCGLVHSLDFRVVQVVGNTGDVIHVDEPENADSLRVVLTADRDDEETDQHRKDRGLSEEPVLDQLIATLVSNFPLVAVCHAINRVSPGLRDFLAKGTLALAPGASDDAGAIMELADWVSDRSATIDRARRQRIATLLRRLAATNIEATP